MKTNSERVADYAKRQKGKGLKRATLWTTTDADLYHLLIDYNNKLVKQATNPRKARGAKIAQEVTRGCLRVRYIVPDTPECRSFLNKALNAIRVEEGYKPSNSSRVYRKFENTKGPQIDISFDIPNTYYARKEFPMYIKRARLVYGSSVREGRSSSYREYRENREKS